MRDPLPDAVDPGDKLEARWTLAEDTVAWSDVAPCSVGTRDDDDERQHPARPPSSGAPRRFPPRPDRNARLRGWLSDDADARELDADAFVCVANERLVPTDPRHRGHLWDDAFGPNLLEAERERVGASCRTGESKRTGAGRLPASHVVYTVAPRFLDKYRTAATNALSRCYRTSLECAAEAGARTVAVPCVYQDALGFPREEAAHVAARTIRRFLEKWPEKFDAVVLCLEGRDEGAYTGGGRVVREGIRHHEDNKRGEEGDFGEEDASEGRAASSSSGAGVLRLYFPRTPEEADRAERLLPEDTGNEHGEARNEERDIVISAGPYAARGGDANKLGATQKSPGEETREGERLIARAIRTDDFASASILGKTESPEARRARERTRAWMREEDGDSDEWGPEDSAFDSWIWGDPGDDPDGDKTPPGASFSPSARRWAKKTLATQAARADLRDVADSGAVALGGSDVFGRRVVCVDAAALDRFLTARRNASEGERAFLMYCAAAMAPEMERDGASRGYVLVYFHSGRGANAMRFELAMRTCEALGVRETGGSALKAFYVVHPTIALRAGMWFGVAFDSLEERVFGKATFVEKLEDLYGYVPEKEMPISAEAKAYDRAQFPAGYARA